MTTGFTISFACVLVMALLPVVCAGLAKSGMMGKPRKDGGYDNDNPRQWLSNQTDWRARANNAQANTFEALPFFFAAVIIAHQLQASQGRSFRPSHPGGAAVLPLPPLQPLLLPPR